MIKLTSLIPEQVDEWQLNAETMRFFIGNISQIADKLSENIDRKLSSGAFGTAWLCDSGRVLKLTGDPHEVTTAIRRRGKKRPHVMSYYGVYAVTRSAEPTWWNTKYVLIMDHVNTLTMPQSETWKRLVAKHDYFDRRGWWDMQEAAQDTAYADEEFAKLAIAQRDKFVAALRRYNIDSREVHDGNVGFDTAGRLTAYDMWTKSSNVRYDSAEVKSYRTFDEIIKRIPVIHIKQNI